MVSSLNYSYWEFLDTTSPCRFWTTLLAQWNFYLYRVMRNPDSIFTMFESDVLVSWSASDRISGLNF